MFFKPVSPEFPWPACLSGPRTLCPTCLSALQFLEPYRQWEILILIWALLRIAKMRWCYDIFALYPLSAIAFTFPLLPCPDDFWDRHCLSGAGGEPDVVIVDIVCCNRFCSFVSFTNLLNLLWSINNLLSGLLIVGECKRHLYHWKFWRKGVTICNYHDVSMIWWSLSIQDDRCTSKPFLHPQSR